MNFEVLRGCIAVLEEVDMDGYDPRLWVVIGALEACVDAVRADDDEFADAE